MLKNTIKPNWNPNLQNISNIDQQNTKETQETKYKGNQCIKILFMSKGLGNQ